jgi:hypothetical protein
VGYLHEVLFENINIKKFLHTASLLTMKGKNIISVTFTNDYQKEAVTDFNILENCLDDPNPYTIHMQVSEISILGTILRRPTLMLSKWEKSNELLIIFEPEDIEGPSDYETDSKFISNLMEFCQSISTQLEANEYFAGQDDANYEGTRLFTKNKLGPSGLCREKNVVMCEESELSESIKKSLSSLNSLPELEKSVFDQYMNEEENLNYSNLSAPYKEEKNPSLRKDSFSEDVRSITKNLISNVDTLNEYAMKTIIEILRGKGTFAVFKDKYGEGWFEKRLENNKGVRLHLNLSFRCFMDPYGEDKETGSSLWVFLKRFFKRILSPR